MSHKSKSNHTKLLRGEVAIVLDFDIVVSDFGLHSSYYLHLRTNTQRKGMNPLNPKAMGKILFLVLQEGWCRHQITHEDWYSTKQRNWTNVQFVKKGKSLSGVKLVWIQNFLSSRLVTVLRLKRADCPTNYPYIGLVWKDGAMIRFIDSI